MQKSVSARANTRRSRPWLGPLESRLRSTLHTPHTPPAPPRAPRAALVSLVARAARASSPARMVPLATASETPLLLLTLQLAHPPERPAPHPPRTPQSQGRAGGVAQNSCSEAFEIPLAKRLHLDGFWMSFGSIVGWSIRDILIMLTVVGFRTLPVWAERACLDRARAGCGDER